MLSRFLQTPVDLVLDFENNLLILANRYKQAFVEQSLGSGILV